MIHKHLITFFTSTLYEAKTIAARIENRCHYSMIPSGQVNKFPRAYFERTNRESEPDIDGNNSSAYIEEDFAIELISNKTSDVDALSDEMWDHVNGLYGVATTDLTVKGMLLENQSDDYEPKGIGADIGLDVAAFNLRVIHGS